jgi:HEAT repeat protein
LEEKKGKRAAEPVMAAIAAHADPTADAALERLASADRPLKVRKQAAFWLGTARSRFGFKALKRLSTDPAEDFRRYLTFALSQSAVPESVDTLIRMARVDESPRVRGQALFWLAQKAGDRAAAAIDNAIREDPDTEVKRQAVFALTQLPKEKGIPQLIRVARTNRNPAVRKQAVFWLGQSKDPRALDFIEEILTR